MRLSTTHTNQLGRCDNNLTCELNWIERHVENWKAHFYVCLWGCFQRRLQCGSVNWVRKSSPECGQHCPVVWNSGWHKKQKKKEAFTLLNSSSTGVSFAAAVAQSCQISASSVFDHELALATLQKSSRTLLLAWGCIISNSWTEASTSWPEQLLVFPALQLAQECCRIIWPLITWANLINPL
jgi:hypothetical protein